MPRPACALRPARRGRAADDLIGSRDRGGHPRGHRGGSGGGSGQTRRYNGNAVVTRPSAADVLADVAYELDRLLSVADAELASGYESGGVGQQPVHTAYVPAHRLGPETVRPWGAQALAAMEEFPAAPAELADATALA